MGGVASALRIVVDQLGIERTLLLQGFPAPVPHTRELPVTRFAGDPESIEVRRAMPGTFRLRAPFNALLTLRLAEAGHEVVGLDNFSKYGRVARNYDDNPRSRLLFPD